MCAQVELVRSPVSGRGGVRGRHMGSGSRGPGRRDGRHRGSAVPVPSAESVSDAVRPGSSADPARSGQRSRVQVGPVGQVAEVRVGPVAKSKRILRRPFGRRSPGLLQAARRVVQAGAVRASAGVSRRERFRAGHSGNRRQQGRSRSRAEVQPGTRSSGAVRATSGRSWVSGPVPGRGGGRRPLRARV